MNQETIGAVKIMQQIGGVCLLCPNKTRDVGVFVPEDGTVYSSPDETKQRTYPYFICENCIEKKDSPEKVENIILRSITMGEMK